MGLLEWADEKLGGVDEAIGSAVSATGEAIGDAVSATGEAINEFAGSIYDAGAARFGYNTRAENAAEEAAAGATKRGEARRDELAQANRGLEAGNGYDPASISQQENWQSFSHQELWETNERSLSQSKATETAEGWRKIGKELDEIGRELKSESEKAINGGWSGQAADSANRSSEPLAQWMTNSGEAFRLTGNKIEEAGTAAGQVKGMVPKPQEPSIGRTVASSIATGPMGGVQDGVAQMSEHKEAERGAQDAMARVLTPTYSNVDTTVPAYKHMDGKPADPATPPPPPPVEPPPPPVSPGDVGGQATNPASMPSSSQVPSAPSATPPGVPAGSGSAWAPDTPGSSQQPGSRIPGMPGNQPPGGGPGAGGAVAGGMPGGGAAGGAGGGAGRAGAGAGAGGAKAGSGAPSAGGRAGAGAVGGAGSGAGGSGSGSGGGARGGGAPMGGGGGGGRGGGGDDEDEHESPDWLQEHDDVWLNDMPATAPPVFGA